MPKRAPRRGTTVHAKKNLLGLFAGEDALFLARSSKAVPGAVDVMVAAGVIAHPSPTQALRMARKAGVAEGDFRKAFGHLL